MEGTYVVDLSSDEREQLLSMTRKGVVGARKLMRAQTLLMADAGRTNVDIARSLSSSESTVYRTRRRFVECGLEHALSDAQRPGGSRKLGAKDEAILVAVACSKPPAGRTRWTLQLLADRLVALTDHEGVSAETVRRRLHELDLKPWQKRMWCIADVTPDFIAQMEAILDLYAEPRDRKRPLVCFDETLRQLVGQTREPLPARPGQTERYDHHYRRNGIAHLAMFFAPQEKWREVRVLNERTYITFAHLMRELVDDHFPDAEVVRVVMDNLNVHTPGALYEAFPPEEARRILRRLEFHYTPVHASWLNMVEIELGILSEQCLDRRIRDKEVLAHETACWVAERNAERATIRWLFNVDDARKKLRRHYPDTSTAEAATPIFSAGDPVTTPVSMY
jgi:transposase